MPRDLRELAEDQPCYLRLWPHCRVEPGNVVLAHYRVGGTGGTSLKPPDVCGAPACHNCHAIIDGRAKAPSYTSADIVKEMLRAENQWLEYLWKNEYLIAVVA